MAEPVRINLWEVLTSVEGRDLSCSERAEKIVSLAGRSPSFGSELDFAVDEYGTWTLGLFSHEADDPARVEMRVCRHGDVTVSRVREGNGVVDRRSVSF